MERPATGRDSGKARAKAAALASLWGGTRISLAQVVVNLRQGDVRLRVVVIQVYRLLHFRDGGLESIQMLKHFAQLVVCCRELRIKPDRLPQVGFRFLRPA